MRSSLELSFNVYSLLKVEFIKNLQVEAVIQGTIFLSVGRRVLSSQGPAKSSKTTDKIKASDNGTGNLPRTGSFFSASNLPRLLDDDESDTKQTIEKDYDNLLASLLDKLILDRLQKKNLFTTVARREKSLRKKSGTSISVNIK